jgi:membrane protease YdiL (CAAX protease family)
MNEAAPQETKQPAKAFPMTRQAVITFSLVLTVIFTVIFSIVTIYFRKQSLPQIFAAGQPPATQIIFGLLSGITIASIVLFLLLKASFFSHLRTFIREVLAQVRPTTLDMLLIATLAGFGEELFFRATLQPALGLWLTSLIFALGHTGISFKPAKLAFAAFVFTMGLLLGAIYLRYGLIAAIVLHAVYDLVFLLAVKRFLHNPRLYGEDFVRRS